MSNLFLKRVGFSMVLGMASLQALAASSDDFVDAPPKPASPKW